MNKSNMRQSHDQSKTITMLQNEIDDLKSRLGAMNRLETSLMIEEGLYRTLENSSQAGIYVVQNGRFQFVNQHTANYWGYSKEELLGMESMSLVHPEDRDRMRDAAIRMLKGERTSSYEFRTIAKDGEIRWITETITPIHYKGSRAVLGNSMDITEQIKARDKLAELEALEASILEAIPHAVIGFRDRKVIFANDGVQSVFGWTAEELIGMRSRVLYCTDEGYEKIAQKLYSTLEKRSTFTTEFPCRRKDGRNIECRVTASRIGDKLTDKSVVITYEDITERKRIEEAYQTMAKSSQAGVYVVQNGMFQFVNHHAAKYADFGEKELVGMNSMSLVHPEDRRMVKENAAKMLRGERTSPHEFRIITKKGAIRWIMETVTLIPYKGGQAILGNSMDITEQIEARNKLAELETLEASILEAIPHAVIGLQDRRIIFANDGVKTVFGWNAGELIGESTRLLYRSDEDYDAIAKRIYAILEKQPIVNTEFTCSRKDGTNIECQITASRIGERLQERRVVITYEDITDRKRAEKELEQSREQLRKLSAYLESVREKERTRIARELHDELGQLLTALNTEIILLNRKIPEKEKILREKTEGMSALVDMTMKTVKRIYMDLRPGMLDHLGLAVAIGWQAEEFQKRTSIPCDVSISPEEINVDPDLATTIFRIFQETLTNISRHAEATRVKVRLKATSRRIELIVKDNGKGITEDQLAKPDSFGLLGIRERVYHWGGTVKIIGIKNKSTTITVVIPLQKTREAA